MDVLDIKIGKTVRIRGTVEEFKISNQNAEFNFYQYSLAQKLSKEPKVHMETNRIWMKKTWTTPKTNPSFEMYYFSSIITIRKTLESLFSDLLLNFSDEMCLTFLKY